MGHFPPLSFFSAKPALVSPACWVVNSIQDQVCCCTTSPQRVVWTHSNLFHDFKITAARTGTWTLDPQIKSLMLYRLSYPGSQSCLFLSLSTENRPGCHSYWIKISSLFVDLVSGETAKSSSSRRLVEVFSDPITDYEENISKCLPTPAPTKAGLSPLAS